MILGTRTVVAPGGIEPFLSTNRSASRSRVGTVRRCSSTCRPSAIPLNFIALAQRNGIPLPVGVAVDLDNVTTTDPKQTLDRARSPTLLPFGGHKGFGLAFMVELLCGASLGMPLGREKLTPFVHEPSHFERALSHLSPDLFVEADKFHEHVERLVGDIKVEPAGREASPRSVCRAESSEHRRAEALARGTLDLEDATWAFLNEGVSQPVVTRQEGASGRSASAARRSVGGAARATNRSLKPSTTRDL